jgi:hypothetical protein
MRPRLLMQVFYSSSEVNPLTEIHDQGNRTTGTKPIRARSKDEL